MSGAPIKSKNLHNGPPAPSMGKGAVEPSRKYALPEWMSDPSKLPKAPPRRREASR